MMTEAKEVTFQMFVSLFCKQNIKICFVVTHPLMVRTEKERSKNA